MDGRTAFVGASTPFKTEFALLDELSRESCYDKKSCQSSAKCRVGERSTVKIVISIRRNLVEGTETNRYGSRKKLSDRVKLLKSTVKAAKVGHVG